MKDNKILILIFTIISIVVIIGIIVISKNKIENYNFTANTKEEISIDEKKIKEHEEKIIQLDKEIKNLRTQYAEKTYLLPDVEIVAYENEAKEINMQCMKLEEEKEEEQKVLEELYEASNITKE